MVGQEMLDRMALVRDEMPAPLDHTINWKLVTAKARSDEGGQRVHDGF